MLISDDTPLHVEHSRRLGRPSVMTWRQFCTGMRQLHPEKVETVYLDLSLAGVCRLFMDNGELTISAADKNGG